MGEECKRVVRILLECFLVILEVTSLSKAFLIFLYVIYEEQRNHAFRPFLNVKKNGNI